MNEKAVQDFLCPVEKMSVVRVTALAGKREIGGDGSASISYATVASVVGEISESTKIFVGSEELDADTVMVAVRFSFPNGFECGGCHEKPAKEVSIVDITEVKLRVASMLEEKSRVQGWPVWDEIGHARDGQ